MKTCISCKQSKDISKFKTEKHTKTGKLYTRNTCIDCRNENARNRHNHKEYTPEEKGWILIDGELYKWCSTCKPDGKFVLVNDFTKNSRAKDGLNGNCNTCRQLNSIKLKAKNQQNVDMLSLEEKGWKLIDNVLHKWCNTCKPNGKWIIVSEFNNDIRAKDGLNGNCKQCLYEYRQLLSSKKRRNNIKRNRYKNDESFKIYENVKSRISHIISGDEKLGKTKELLGIPNIEFYLDVLSDQFTSEMTLDNYGKVWHIDHIILLSAFDVTNDKEQFIAFNYRNTQPLLKSDNLKKFNKFTLEHIQMVQDRGLEISDKILNKLKLLLT